jgi:hypothetical protein
MAPSSTTNEWATGLPPCYNERQQRLRGAGDQIDCFICSDAVNPAKCPKWSIPLWPCSEAGAMLGSFARR